MQEITDMDLELINLIDHDTTKIFQHKIPIVFKEDDISLSEDNSLVNIYHDNQTKKSQHLQEEASDRLNTGRDSYQSSKQLIERDH